jgi:endonuclease YncB( thermonuclease family)
VNAAATAVLLWLCLAAAHAETLTGKVVSVDDGDTLTVLSENVRQRVRIAGIDAPEKGQDYAHRSWQSLMLMAYGKDATLDCHKTDRYQRRVCKVMVQPQGCPRCGHTLDLGLAQIVAGAARWDRRYGREQSAQERGRYASEETEARLRRRGLWGLPEPIPQSQHCVRR